MKNFILLLFTLFHFTASAQWTGTVGRYAQGNDVKQAQLMGYGTDELYNKPQLRFAKWDGSRKAVFLYDFFMVSMSTPAYLDEGEDPYANLEVIFIFKNDAKNKKWKVTEFQAVGKDDISTKESTVFKQLFVFELTNIDTHEKLGRLAVFDKLKASREVVVTVTDDYSDVTNVCRFQVRKFRNLIKKVESDRYKSKKGALLN